MAGDQTALLPAELLLGVLDYLCLPELARFCSISKRWTTVIKSHPTYWSQPELVNTSPPAIALFTSRIAASFGKPFEVGISVPERFALLETTLIPNLTAHLDRVVRLVLHVHITHAAAVFSLLTGAAPLLRYLQIFFHIDKGPDSATPTAVTLPTDILCRGAHPDGMETLLLQNIDIVRPLTPALSTAVNLVYSHKGSQPSTTLHTLAEVFPSARDVSLLSSSVPVDVDASDWPPSWVNLDSLTISTGKRSLRNAIRVFPLAGLDHLTIVGSMQQELLDLVFHLRGPLHLAFKVLPRGTFLIHLASWTDGMKRSFREHRDAWIAPDSSPHQLLQSPMLSEHLISLTIPASLWTLLVAHLPQRHRLHQLILVIFSDFTLSHLLAETEKEERVLICPDLQTFTIATVGGPKLASQADIVRVLLELLRAPAPIQLGLQNVYVQGWTGMPGLIDTVLQREVVELYPSTPWHM